MDDEERRKTLELLWRLETGEGVVSDDSDQDDVEDDGRSVDELLGMLSLADRQRFQSLLRDPSRAARMYFDDEELVQLWWSGEQWPGTDTAFASDVSAMAAAPPARVDLRYNVLGVLLAYTYTLRHLQLASCTTLDKATVAEPSSASLQAASVPADDDDSDGEPPPLEDVSDSTSDTPAHAPAERSIPDTKAGDTDKVGDTHDTPLDDTESAELRDSGVLLLERLAPFLFAPPRTPDATLVLTSIEDAGLYLLQKLGPKDMGTEPGQLLLALLRDVEPLCEPRSVAEADDALGAAPLLHALADLDGWLRPRKSASKKLVFYAHAYASAPHEAQQSLHRSLQREIERLEKEQDDQQHVARVAAANSTVGRMDTRVQRLSAPNKIEVLE